MVVMTISAISIEEQLANLAKALEDLTNLVLNQYKKIAELTNNNFRSTPEGETSHALGKTI